MRTRSVFFAASAVLALPLWPSAAFGAEVSTQDAPRKMRIQAAAGEANVIVIQQSGDSFTVSDAGAAITIGVLESGSCLSEGLSQVRCTLPADFRVDVDLGDLDDSIAYGIQATGSVDGGAGADVLRGGDGQDDLDGGAGDDRLHGGAGADKLYGGDGRDVADYSGATAALSVTPEGTAPTVPNNDGAAGENDSVASDVESVIGGSGSDALTAGVAGGDLEGGDGDDFLTGSAAADRLVGGGGADTFLSGDGDDTLVARDGVEESLECGAGTDGGLADREDIVSSDCENVVKPALPAGTPQTPEETVQAVEAAVDERLRDIEPVPGRTFGALAASGTVLVRVTGSNRFTPLRADQPMPMGTTIDARRGQVAIVAAHDLDGHAQGANFTGGVFVVRQTKSSKLVTRLHMVSGSFTGCTRARASARRRSSKPVRRLWGSGKGNFQTHGRDSVASVRGTIWSVADYCSGTLTKVESGVVDVRDKVRRKTVRVRAGQRYLARHR